MAVYEVVASTTKNITIDQAANPFGFVEIGEGGDTHFTVLVLDVNGASYYYWPNSSGALRYGTTAPTTSTQDTEGAAV